MSAIPETCNRTHNILKLEDVLPNVSSTASDNSKGWQLHLTKNVLQDILPP